MVPMAKKAEAAVRIPLAFYTAYLLLEALFRQGLSPIAGMQVSVKIAVFCAIVLFAVGIPLYQMVNSIRQFRGFRGLRLKGLLIPNAIFLAFMVTSVVELNDGGPVQANFNMVVLYLYLAASILLWVKDVVVSIITKKTRQDGIDASF